MSYALITGASKGIGKAFAYELAEKGYSLLLTARSEKLLTEIANDIRAKYKVEVKVYAADLSSPDSPAAILRWVENSEVDLSILINNAGYGLWGKFNSMALSEQLNMLELNVTALIKLTHLLLPQLLKQKKSYLLNVASTTAYQAIPAMAVYGASKSFVVNYSRALKHELKDTSVSVTCLSPGSTATEFMDRAGINDTKIRKQAEQVNMTPEAVAKIAMAGLFKGETEIIPGVANKATFLAAKFLPKILIEKIAANIYLR